ncbi:MAG: efflux RND transporter permease subunit, partial [Gammaproteobacteria bacterium]
MLATIVRSSLAAPRIVTALSLLVALLGTGALLGARLDVFPDFAPPHVLVQVEAPGLDATQVESLVTRPLEDVLGGAENVEAVRSTSSQGLAAIQVVFGRGSDPYLQRQVISERLGGGSALLPPGIGPPQLSPLSSSMEYLLHFGFTSDRLSPLELHDLVRWTLKPQILAVPGVAQAQIFGGESRERQLWVDPVKLNAAGVTLEELSEAARRATLISGGGYLETAVQRLVLRAQAPAESLSALGQAVVATPAGVPVRIGDIAQVRDGAAPRFGDAMIGGHPGILVETSTQYGANTLEVTRGLEHRLEILATQLAPRGVRYHPALLRPASFIE